MARKKTAARLNRLTAAAAAADSTDTEEDVSTDNDDQHQKQPPQNNPENKQVSGDSDSDSDETQNSPTASAFTVRPISSKPMMDTSISPKSKKPAAAQSKSKRPVVIDNKSNDSGKKKKKVVAAEEDVQIEKKPGGAANRLWSEDDEIAILEGMIEYQVGHGGGDPNADIAAFHEFVKGAISVEVSKNQLYEKIRRLKKKYKVNVEKGGNDPVFLKKGQEKKLFELSKKIWGGGGGNVNGVAKGSKGASGKKKDKVKDVGVVVENGSAIKLIKDKVEEEKEEVGVKSDKNEECEEEEEEEKVVDGVKDVVMAEGVDGYVEEKDGDDFLAMFPRLRESFEVEQSNYLSLPNGAESLVKEKIRLIGRDNAKMLEAKWHNIRVMEFELYIKKIKLFQEQNQMLMRKM